MEAPTNPISDKGAVYVYLLGRKHLHGDPAICNGGGSGSRSRKKRTEGNATVTNYVFCLLGQCILKPYLQYIGTGCMIKLPRMARCTFSRTTRKSDQPSTEGWRRDVAGSGIEHGLQEKLFHSIITSRQKYSNANVRIFIFIYQVLTTSVSSHNQLRTKSVVIDTEMVRR